MAETCSFPPSFHMLPVNALVNQQLETNSFQTNQTGHILLCATAADFRKCILQRQSSINATIWMTDPDLLVTPVWETPDSDHYSGGHQFKCVIYHTKPEHQAYHCPSPHPSEDEMDESP